jgi:hypothetical protein
MITSQYQGNGMASQGADLASMFAQPMQNQAQGFQQGYPAYQQVAPQGAGLAPQGFDFSGIINPIIQSLSQQLPGILAGLLSTQQQAQQAGRQFGAVNPQGLFNVGLNTPFGNANFGAQGNAPQFGAQPGFAPQGIDFGSILRFVAEGAARVLPGLLMSLLSSHPQLQQLARQGGAGAASPQGWSQGWSQGLYNVGQGTPFGNAGVGIFGNAPQAGAGVTPQGFDFGAVLQTVVQAVAQTLPGLLLSLLSSHPQIQQIARQAGGGINPQSIGIPGIGAGIGLFPNQAAGMLPIGGGAQQGFDDVLNTVAQGVAQAIPGLLLSLLSANPQVRQLAAQGIDLGQAFGGRGTLH